MKSALRETENDIIYIDESKLNQSLKRVQNAVDLLQGYVNEWHETTGTDLQTDDLPAIVGGSMADLKSLLFDKLAAATKTTNDKLFGIKINKAKALELLDMPDVAPIFANRTDEMYQVSPIDIEDFQINEKGKVSTKPGFEAKEKARNTITADNEAEKARLQGFWQIVEILQNMQKSGAIAPVYPENYLGRVIRLQTNTGQISVNHNYIKTGTELHGECMEI